MVTMIGKETTPLPREAIDTIDTLLAKQLLVLELRQIPEFLSLWHKARQIPDQVMEVIWPKLKEIFRAMSPEARGALLMGEKASAFYGEGAITEAAVAVSKLNSLTQRVAQFLNQHAVQVDYPSTLKDLVEPLGVPNLVEVMLVWDMAEWNARGINQNQGTNKAWMIQSEL